MASGPCTVVHSQVADALVPVPYERRFGRGLPEVGARKPAPRRFIRLLPGIPDFAQHVRRRSNRLRIGLEIVFDAEPGGFRGEVLVIIVAIRVTLHVGVGIG